MRKLLILILAISSTALSASYDGAIGLRSPVSAGITYKNFVSNSNAIEGILSSRWGGVQLDILWEHHKWDFGNKNFYWFYGGGAYIAFFDENNNTHPWRDDQDVRNLLGVSGVAGIEYKFPKAPFNLTIDWKPYLNFIGGLRFQAYDFSLSVRYTF